MKIKILIDVKLIYKLNEILDIPTNEPITKVCKIDIVRLQGLVYTNELASKVCKIHIDS